jgi:tripartite-type tricarboxylate transporter receptor subunit TctC
MNELRIQSLPTGSWMGLFAPAGTPRPIVEKLFAAAKRAAEDPDVKRAAAAEGMFVHISSSPEEFKSFVEKDTWTCVHESTRRQSSGPLGRLVRRVYSGD